MTEGGRAHEGWWGFRFWPGIGFSAYAILASALSAITTGRPAFWVMTAVAVIFLGAALYRRRSHPPRAKTNIWQRPLPTWGGWARNIFALAWIALVLLGVFGAATRLLAGDRASQLDYSYVAAATIWAAILVSGLVWLAAEFRSGYAKPNDIDES